MNRLQLLDYGRFFAALIVVEFFFMISGYVIFFSAKNRTASQFIVSRAVRLYPSFWFAVLFTSAIAFFWGKGEMSVSALQALTNLTLFAPSLGFPYVDGVYWTLQYEINFYALIFLVLFLGFQHRLELIFMVWPIFMIIALILEKNWLPFMGGYYSYFVAGSLFAMAKNKPSQVTLIMILITLCLCINFSAGKADNLTLHKGVEYSAYIIASLVVFIFTFFALLNTKKVGRLTLPYSSVLGGLTYPVYLIHAHFGYMFVSRYADESNKVLIYIVCIAIVMSVAYLMHKLVEIKLSSLWKRIFDYMLGEPIRYVSSKLSRRLLTNNKNN